MTFPQYFVMFSDIMGTHFEPFTAGTMEQAERDAEVFAMELQQDGIGSATFRQESTRPQPMTASEERFHDRMEGGMKREEP
jgi:hypothetical protein